MAIVWGVALVSFGSFFEWQDKNKITADIESQIGLLDMAVKSGELSDYTLSFTGDTLGYIIEKNRHGKSATNLLTMTYNFDGNTGMLRRASWGTPWTIDLYAENKLQKTYLTLDQTLNFSLPEGTTRTLYSFKTRIDGVPTNQFAISFFSPRNASVDQIRLKNTIPAIGIVRKNELGTLLAGTWTLLFEQASKEFQIELK